MADTADPNGVLELLARHEDALAELYRAYAGLFPFYAELWSKLAEEEVLHAAWLREVPGRLGAAPVPINAARFRAQAVRTSVQSAIREKDKAVQPGYAKRTALAVALGFETAMLEKDFFSVLECGHPGCQDLQRRLQEHTAAHRERIRQSLQALG